MDVFKHGGGTYDLFDASHASLFQDLISIWGREIEIQRVLKPCPVLDLLYLFQSLKEKGKVIAGFGAPTKATTLMAHFGLDEKVLDFIVDDMIDLTFNRRQYNKTK